MRVKLCYSCLNFPDWFFHISNQSESLKQAECNFTLKILFKGSDPGFGCANFSYVASLNLFQVTQTSF